MNKNKLTKKLSIDPKEEPRLEFWMNKSSDYTIRREVIERNNYREVAQYLTLAPGAGLSEHRKLIRIQIPDHLRLPDNHLLETRYCDFR